MKKYLIAAILCGVAVFAVKARAEQMETPTGPPQSLATPAYGGVYYSTSVFTVEVTTVVASGQGVFHGIHFSSGLCSLDFVDVYDSTSAPANAAQTTSFRMARIYNVSGSTTSGLACSGFSGPTYPMKFQKGLRFQPGQNTYNLIDILYYTKP